MNSKNSVVLSVDRNLRWLCRYFGGLLALFILSNMSGCAAVGPDYVPMEIQATKIWNSYLY